MTGEPAVSSKSGQEPIAGPSHMAYEYGKSEGYREPALDNREEKYFDYKSVERSFMGEYTSDESRHIPPALPRDHFEREPEDKMEGQGTLPARFQRFSKVSETNYYYLLYYYIPGIRSI